MFITDRSTRAEEWTPDDALLITVEQQLAVERLVQVARQVAGQLPPADREQLLAAVEDVRDA